MSRKKKFYIKERNNPQFDKPYYIGKGQLTKKKALSIENSSSYGHNIMLSYDTEEEYNEALKTLK